jgi:Ca2+-binding EF-hand superfamily protein
MENSLNLTLRRAVLPAACAAVLSGCVMHDRVVERSATPASAPASTTVVVTPRPATVSLFDQLDVNRDGYLTRDEVAVLGLPATATRESAEQMFRNLDTNRDGFLSRAEAGDVFSRIPGGSFEKFDLDRDGFLSLAEARPHLQYLAAREGGVLSFDALDTDRDGRLSRAEAEPLLSAARRVDGRWIVIAPATTFERLDTNRDGFLSRQEAAAAMTPQTFDYYDTNRDGFLSRAEAEPLFRSQVGGTGGGYGSAVYGPR